MDSPPVVKITVMHACRWGLYRKGVRSGLERKPGIEFIGEASDGKDLIEGWKQAMLRKN